MTADEIVNTLQSGTWVGITFYGGYAVSADGKRFLFGPLKTISERHNREGRCTSGLYEAPDGYRIKYTYSTRTERATFAVA